MSVHDLPVRQRILAHPSVAEQVIRERAERGMDRFDEVWDGEYRMVAAPNNEHDRIDTDINYFLITLVRKHKLGRVGYMNVGRPGRHLSDYRIPDRIFVSKARGAKILDDWGCIGGPELAIEIRSPGADTYEKLPFYGDVGVDELLIVHRDSKKVEHFRAFDRKLTPMTTAADGWFRFDALPLEVRTVVKEDGAPGVELRDARDPSCAEVV